MRTGGETVSTANGSDCDSLNSQELKSLLKKLNERLISLIWWKEWAESKCPESSEFNPYHAIDQETQAFATLRATLEKLDRQTPVIAYKKTRVTARDVEFLELRLKLASTIDAERHIDTSQQFRIFARNRILDAWSKEVGIKLPEEVAEQIVDFDATNLKPDQAAQEMTEIIPDAPKSRKQADAMAGLNRYGLDARSALAVHRQLQFVPALMPDMLLFLWLQWSIDESKENARTIVASAIEISENIRDHHFPVFTNGRDEIFDDD